MDSLRQQKYARLIQKEIGETDAGSREIDDRSHRIDLPTVVHLSDDDRQGLDTDLLRCDLQQRNDRPRQFRVQGKCRRQRRGRQRLHPL